jgi:CBS domain-containing protein
MRVLDVMTTEVVTVTPDDGLKAAARIMIEKGISGLPVVDADGRLAGIITEADFVKQEAGRSQQRYRRLLDALFGEREARPMGETVADAMTRHPVVVDKEARIAEAAREMADRGIKRLPVVDDDGRLLGIISRADIMKAFARPDEVIEDQVREDIIHRVLMIDREAVGVALDDGHVSLSGKVPTRSDARLLEELVRRVEGVVGVEADLAWDVDDTKPPHLES